MPKVRVLKRHAHMNGIGVWRVGEEYDEVTVTAQQKVARGFVEYVDGEPVIRSKEDQDMYRTRSFRVPGASEKPPFTPTGLTLVELSGNWYTLSDGEKVLGKLAAAEALGVSVEDLEAMSVAPDAD